MLFAVQFLRSLSRYRRGYLFRVAALLGGSESGCPDPVSCRSDAPVPPGCLVSMTGVSTGLGLSPLASDR